MDFTKKPTQDKLRFNPNYNSHNFLAEPTGLLSPGLLQNQLFFWIRQNGRYSAWDILIPPVLDLTDWMGLKRTYTAIQAQKYWLLGKNLISTTVGFGGFWHNQSVPGCGITYSYGLLQ